MQKTHVTKLGTDVKPWRFNLSGVQTTHGFSSMNNVSFPSTNDGFAVLDKQYVNNTGVQQLLFSVRDLVTIYVDILESMTHLRFFCVWSIGGTVVL